MSWGLHVQEERAMVQAALIHHTQIFCEDPAGNLVELNTGWTQEPVR